MKQITSTDAKKIRRVRKDSLETAARWRRDYGFDSDWKGAILNVEATAAACLERLRELKAAA